MNRRPLTVRCVAFLLAALLAAMLGAPPVFAQDQGQAAAPRAQAPVMQNVFYNVVWGSAVGALIGFAGATESSKDKTQPDNARAAALEGATIGGLVGLGVGIWLVYAGITFETQGSTITQAPGVPGSEPIAFQPKDLAPAPGDRALLAMAPPAADFRPPFTLETAPGQSGKITGFRALVVDLRF
jgi:hypothetical protein